MERDVIQVFASTYVAESDIDIEEKLRLIDYIKEADEFEIMHLISTGDVLAEDEYIDEEYAVSLAESYYVNLEPLFEKKASKSQHYKTVLARKAKAAKKAAAAAGTAVAAGPRPATGPPAGESVGHGTTAGYSHRPGAV